MIETVSFTHFYDTFKMYRPDNFSYSGLHVLFDYLEEYENSTGEQIELDCIAICCEYSESTPAEIIADYSLDSEEYDEDDIDKLVEYLEEQTSVCGITRNNTIVYQVF
jgi:hypothetical protein